jgi:hypothetical protein
LSDNWVLHASISRMLSAMLASSGSNRFGN